MSDDRLTNTVNACNTIVHALVTSKLDYGNAVLFDAKFGSAHDSESETAAPRSHITPVLIALHWLPIQYRIIGVYTNTKIL